MSKAASQTRRVKHHKPRHVSSLSRQRIHLHIHAGGADEVVRRAVGVIKTGLEEGIDVLGVEFHIRQRIRRVMHLTAAKAAWRLGEQ